jgi:hypothetical protein
VKIAMQTRCVKCGLEQYAPAVMQISFGEHPCAWCGHTPPMMSEEEYRNAHALRKAAEDAA